MFKLIRQANQHVRLWLIAAAAVLVLTSILEAGHAHGVFTQTDDQCTLCQHSVALDKLLTPANKIIVPIAVNGFVLTFLSALLPAQQILSAPIRAPPKPLHTQHI